MNLVEGRCLGPKQDLFLLVDKRGWFKQSFLRLRLLYLVGLGVEPGSAVRFESS